MTEPSTSGGSSGASRRSGGGRTFFARPSTKPGWWAVGLLAVFVIMVAVNVTIFQPAIEAAPWRESLLPAYSIIALSSGLAAAVVGLFAVARRHERSLPVWLTLLFGLLAILFLLGELLGPEH